MRNKKVFLIKSIKFLILQDENSIAQQVAVFSAFTEGAIALTICHAFEFTRFVH